MLRWYYKMKMGSLTVTQDNRSYKINIYGGNATAIFIHHYNSDDGKKMVQLYMFLNDKQHIKNIMKNNKEASDRQFAIFSGKVSNVKLNMWYKENYDVLKFFLWMGCKVSCYYKEDVPNGKSK